MPRLSTAFVVALLAIVSRPGSADELPEQCAWKFEQYASSDRSYVCMCGPPSGMVLNLEPLTEDLGIEQPRFEGHILQQVGGIVGTYTYAPGSNICLAAQHAGLLQDSAKVGGIVTFMSTDGCERYEGTTQNDMRSQDGYPQARSFHFPKLTNGGCPGEAGYGNRYAGRPALEAVLGLLSVVLPADAVRHASATSQGHEAFTIERLFLRPPGRPAIAIGKLTVERVDMEYGILKLPPRYLTLRAEQVSLPSSYLGPVLETAFEGARLSFDASLDLYFNLEVGRLELKEARLAIAGEGTLSLQGRLNELKSAFFFGDAQGDARPAWARLRLEDEGLLARLLPVLWNRGQSATPQALRDWLLPVLQAARSDLGPRARAIVATAEALLADLEAPAGPLILHAESRAPLSIDEIARLYRADPSQAAADLSVAFFYGGFEPPPAPADGTPFLAATKQIFQPEEPLRFTFAGASGEGDRIALHRAGDSPPSTSLGRWELDGKTQGDVSRDPLPPGLYEAVLWHNDGNWPDEAAAFVWFAVE